MKIIPYGKQYIDKNDILSVSRALKSDKITSGLEVQKFEKKISNYLGCKYSVTCSNGTSALFMAMKAANVSNGDIVIMPSITFVASYNVATILGARVYLADVDPDSGQMTPQDVKNCCKKFNLKNIKAIIVMYHSGYPQNAENFKKLKKIFKSTIIEDACHALGAKYQVKDKKFKIGSCKHADISTFSLHPLKTITTGEGGIITTNSKSIYDKLILLRSHGIQRNTKKHWEYDVFYNSLNFRLTDIQCALGISQLSKIDKFVYKRKKISKIYDEHLSLIDQIKIFKCKKNYLSSYHLYVIKVKKANIKEKLIKYMLKNKIFLQYHYIPIYEFKVFKNNKISKNSKYFYQSAISLPIYYELGFKKQMYVIKKIKDFFKLI